MRGCQGGMHGWGACMVAGGCAWLQRGMHGCGGVVVGGMHGFWEGMHGCWGHAWLPGGCAWLLGVCVVAGGGMCGCGGHVWLGGMHGWGGVHRMRRDTVNERAVHILMECIFVVLLGSIVKHHVR